jgi:uncharacterized protein (TIRG00374 family)
LKPIRLLVGILVSALCLWLALRNVPFSNLVSHISSVRYSWLVAAVLIQVLALFARARLWLVLLDRKPRFSDSFWSENIGYLFTNILPLRMGDPARVVVMSGRAGLPLVQVATSAFMERLLDLLMILLALIVIFPMMNVPAQVKKVGIAFGLVAIMTLFCLILLANFREGGTRMVRSVCNRFPIIPRDRILGIWQDFTESVAMLSRRSVAVRAALWSLTVWFLTIAVYWCVFRSFQPDSTLVEATFMLVAVCLAATLPTSPGALGVFQWVGQQALVLPFGGKYDDANALAIALTVHMTYYFVTSLLGAVGLSQLGVTFSGLRKDLGRRWDGARAVELRD